MILDEYLIDIIEDLLNKTIRVDTDKKLYRQYRIMIKLVALLL